PPSRTITQRIGYRVRPGDSLSRISSRFNVTVAQLRRWNSLPKGRYLQPGQRLVVYVDVTRQSG
ncbi:MAG: LysM peptidoglycan-binding domain-containing protein, partial [Pseudomonadota bacterium]